MGGIRLGRLTEQCLCIFRHVEEQGFHQEDAQG